MDTPRHRPLSIDEWFQPPANLIVQVPQAMGMVSIQMGVQMDQALVRLRIYAALTAQSVVDVADSVVQRRLMLLSPATVDVKGNVVWWDLGRGFWGPRQVRHNMKALLTGWCLADDDQHDAQYVASELVSNAVEHAAGVMGVAVSRIGDDLVKVAVIDGSAAVPNLQPDNPLSKRGRGLQAVDGLASSWGYDTHEFGKTVWAQMQYTHA